MAVNIYVSFKEGEGETFDSFAMSMSEVFGRFAGLRRGATRGSRSSTLPVEPATLTLHVIKQIQAARDSLLNMDGAQLRYPCSQCEENDGECPGDMNWEIADSRHSSTNYISELLLRLAQIKPEQRMKSTPREALMAALKARNAAIEGDFSSVAEFSQTWLGISHPKRWHDAVEMALLGDWVNDLRIHTSHDEAVVGLLKQHVALEHRYQQPIWERKVRGWRLRLLDAPMANGLCLGDVITDHRRPEDLALFKEVEDSRLATVLRALDPAEAAVALTYCSNDLTWTEAATQSGAADPKAIGERVRRKVKRLGRRVAAARNAAGVTR